MVSHTAVMFDCGVPTVIGPMDTIGDADNAVIEVFCGRMQTELLDRRRWTTHVELANAGFA